MDRKLFSVFFSALVCSTLGHEYLKAQEVKTRYNEGYHSIGFHNARANPQECSYLCPSPAPSSEMPRPSEALRLVYIEESKVFALVNTTSEVTIVFQIGEPIALLANGNSSESVVINIHKETVVHYPAGSNDNLWKKSQVSLLDYLHKLGPLMNLNKWKNGQTSKLNSVTKEVKNVIISIIQHLDTYGIAARAKTNPDCVVSLISVSINDLLDSSDVLSLLLVNLKSSVTVIYGGLNKVVNLVVGLKAIGQRLQGGLSSLITNSTSVSNLLGEDSGLTSLLYLLIQVDNQVDLTKVLGNLLNPEDLFGLAVKLDRGKYIGIRGITAVIYNVQLYAAKKISLEALIDVLIQAQSANGVIKITKEIWHNILNWYFVLSETQASQFKTGTSWSTLDKFFQDMKNDKLVIKGINVSAIINILITTSGQSSLSNVVKILHELKSVVALSKIIATLYYRLIWFVISGQGLIFINHLLPNISTNINLSSSTSVLKQILSKVNIVQIVSYLAKLDVVGAITHLPIFDSIFKALDGSIKALGKGTEVTVASSLKSVGSILNDLKQFILYGLGRGGKAPSHSGIAGLSNLGGGGISVSLKTTWTSSEEWSSSNGGSEGLFGSTPGSQGGSGSNSGWISLGGSSSHSGGQKGSSSSGWSLFGG